MEEKDLKIVQDHIIDTPDNRDYLFDEYLKAKEEYADGWTEYRPENKVTVFDQWRSAKCTWFALQHIVNWYNIIEDIQNTDNIIRPQKDPNEYLDNRVHSLQDRLKQFRELWLIEWYVSIPRVWWNTPTGVMTVERRNEELKKAMQKWYFIYTWSNRAKRTMGMNPVIKFGDYSIWHAFSLVKQWDIYHSKDNLYKFINSWWTKWWDNGYWYIEEKDVDKLFTAYIIIDKKDSEFFQRFKANRKVTDLILKAKEIYYDSNNEQKKYWETIQLTKNLIKLYNL